MNRMLFRRMMMRSFSFRVPGSLSFRDGARTMEPEELPLKGMSMRSCTGLLLILMLCGGCNRAEEARRKAVENNLKQIGAALQNYQQTHPSADTSGAPLLDER